MLALRRPAPDDTLARRIAGIDWHAPPPREGSRWWLVETCRAELEWAAAQWRRLDPSAESDGAGRTGPHPAEALRLPHEREAARLVNAHLHVDAATARIRELLARLPGQRAAAADSAQSQQYRAGWQQRAAGCESELRAILVQRRRAWRIFLAAASRYRRLRAALLTTSRAAA
jgi:hypothetical protein